jgi:arsenate reductase
MNNFTIYHNPRCSKSRQTLELIKEKGIEPEIILYLEHPPTVSVLSKILEYLQIKPRDLLRKGEDEYKSFNLKDTGLDDSVILEIMSENPKLIERPIVLSGDKAIIGRPPENVLELIK